MGAMASHITSFTIVYATVYSDADRRKNQSFVPLFLCGEFPSQMASNAEYVSVWWRHHDLTEWFYLESVYPLGLRVDGDRKSI